MPIPGKSLQLDVRGKVRVGEKKTSARGKAYPSSTDYFVSTDPEVAGKPKTLRVVFPYPSAAENFSSGLEWWTAKLNCYTKGEGDPPVAFRLEEHAKGWQSLGKVGKERVKVACPFRECPQFKSRDCRPMGRLDFLVEGGRDDAVLRFDTKSWNSIENLERALALAERKGPLTGRVFELSVELRQKGTDRFPVIDLKETGVPITEQNIGKAEARLAIERDRVAGKGNREILAAALDLTNPGWRDKPAYIEKIKAVGAEAALAGLVKGLDKELA